MENIFESVICIEFEFVICIEFEFVIDVMNEYDKCTKLHRV